MLPTLGHTAVFELEDETHANVQVLAGSLRLVALNADHPLVICKQTPASELRPGVCHTPLALPMQSNSLDQDCSRRPRAHEV